MLASRSPSIHIMSKEDTVYSIVVVIGIGYSLELGCRNVLNDFLFSIAVSIESQN